LEIKVIRINKYLRNKIRGKEDYLDWKSGAIIKISQEIPK